MDKKKAFTIVELMVAMALLVILVGLSSVVFSTTVKSHRTAMATIEITRKLNAVTNQLNADFQGLRKDAPMMLWFDSPPSGSSQERFDMIHFFADGDFQTTKQYDYDSDDNGTIDGSKTITGNIARIFYGHANSVAVAPLDFAAYQVLSRKAHILTADSDILSVYDEIPLISNWPLVPTIIDYSLFDTSFGLDTYTAGTPAKTYTIENGLEFNTITPTNWINALNYLDGADSDNADHFITNCLTDAARPFIDLADFNTLHLLMAQGVMDFSIQWAYTPDDLQAPVAGFTEGIRWWPSVDPDGDPLTNDSDFDTQGMNVNPDRFGVYFELPNFSLPAASTNTNWFAIDSCRTKNVNFSSTFYPAALKFTFRLKDSNTMFPDGKTFTHIVYLDN